MISDSELLQRFVKGGEQDALAELVRRHIDLVYSAALRRVGGDAHFAADVTQKVFLDFMRNARALQHRSGVEGWLYVCTNYIAANLVRAEQRRRKREREAHFMAEINSGADRSEWEAFYPVLDDAMLTLREADRRAILLRYFQRKPWAEVGRILGISENAAARRAERALEKLRQCLSKRGLTSTGSALGAMLTHHATTTAPAGLSAGISTAALTTTSQGLASWPAWSPIAAKTYPFAVAVVALMGTGIFFYLRNTQPPPGFAVTTTRARDEPVRGEKIPDTAPIPSGSESVQLPTDVAPVAAKTADASWTKLVPAKPATKVRRPLALQNFGRRTPAAALDTALYAVTTGDLPVASEAMQLDEDDAAYIQAVFTQLSERAQKIYGTPERMAGALLLTEGKRRTGYVIDVEYKSGPDDSLLGISWVDLGGKERVPLHRVEGQWKVVLAAKGIGNPEQQSAWREMAERVADTVEKQAAERALARQLQRQIDARADLK